MYEINDRRGAIREIQRYLLALHYFTDSIPFLTIDGVYDRTTKDAVVAYQSLRGLPTTGVVDEATFDLLFTDYSAASVALAKNAFIPPDTPLPVGVGKSGAAIRNLQELIAALLPRYGIRVTVDRSGIFSYATARAVNALRRVYRLPEDGTVTNELFLKMQRDYENPPKTPVSPE